MTADYAQVVKSGRAWVAEHGDRIVGLLVLEPVEDHLLLENMAVAPQAQGWPSWQLSALPALVLARTGNPRQLASEVPALRPGTSISSRSVARAR